MDPLWTLFFHYGNVLISQNRSKLFLTLCVFAPQHLFVTYIYFASLNDFLQISFRIPYGLH